MSYKYHISIGLSIRRADYLPKNIRFPMKRKPVFIIKTGFLFMAYPAYLIGDRYFAQKGLIFPLS